MYFQKCIYKSNFTQRYVPPAIKQILLQKLMNDTFNNGPICVPGYVMKNLG
jgi:hypothetical protein